MSKCLERLYNGIVKENPTFVLMLGMCPTLAVTTSLINGVGMGLSTTAVLVMSNIIISMLRKIIPNGVRVPAFIVIVASLVTILQFMLEAYLPSLNDALGIYISLIVVNCIILGRAESYASKNPVIPSAFDGLGMGLGFTVGLSFLGAFREILGSGAVAGYQLLGKDTAVKGAVGKVFSHYEPITIFVMAPGAFFVLACLVAIQNKIKIESGKKIAECDGNCMACAASCDSKVEAKEEAKVEKKETVKAEVKEEVKAEAPANADESKVESDETKKEDK